ncbi:MAG: cytochrome family [Solirubrobacteraceae bacterium]|nr:cytochrome family [Solirubrobacteraceae bacterium]
MNLPPGPSESRLRSTLKWQFRATAVMHAARQRYGDVWLLRLLGSTDFVIVSDPELLRDVYSADPAVLHTGVGTVGKPLMGARSVLLLDEDDHTSMRKLMAPGFRSEQVRQYRGVTERICEQELAGWPLNEALPLLPLMEGITLNVIMSAIFGVTEDDRRELLRERISGVVDWGSSPARMARLMISQRRDNPAPSSFRKVVDALDEVVFDVIKQAREDPRLDGRDDILAMLLQSRFDDGSPMTDRDLRDTLVTLLIQGHASTADGLCWALERLIRHPEVYERLREEARTEDEEYLDAVVKETLRVRPPLPIASRLVMQPYTLGEYELEPGILIAPCIYMVHRREDVYPEPERFRPERFLEKPAERDTWMPFGGGVRGCLGASFALHEIKTVLRTLMLRARFATTDEPDEPIVRRRIGFAPGRGARATLVERLPAP